MFRYMVLCLIKPKSGFDLARRNKVMDMFKEAVADSYPHLEEMTKKFDDQSDGMIFEPFVMETDREIANCETELMPEIRKNHPEAKLLFCEKMPHLA